MHSRSAETSRSLCLYCIHISMHVRLTDKLNTVYSTVCTQIQDK